MSLPESKRLDLIDSYFETYGHADIQIRSFNKAIHEGFQRTVEEENTLTVEGTWGKYTVKFMQLHFSHPSLTEENRKVRLVTPCEIAFREEHYEMPVKIDIETTLVQDGVETTARLEQFPIGRIPCMVGSYMCNLYRMNAKERSKAGECPYDPGGYFIMKKSRVLISQDRNAHNIPTVQKQKPSSKYKIGSKVRSMAASTGHSVQILCMCNSEGIPYFSLPYIREHIQVGTVFVALGFNAEDIYHLVAPDTKETIYICETIIAECEHDPVEARKYIGSQPLHTSIPESRREKYVSQVLENEVILHYCGVLTSKEERGLFLASMVRKAIYTYTGDRVLDERDHLANKRIETAGELMETLFRSVFKRMVRGLVPHLTKRPDIRIALDRCTTVTNAFRGCFLTGKWGIQKNATFIRLGVAQVVSRQSAPGFFSHLNRIAVPVGREGKNTELRQIQCSQFGFVCPAETPEGGASGLVRNFSLGCKVTTHISPALVQTQISVIDGIEDVNDVDIKDFSKHTRIFLNGAVIGLTASPLTTCSNLREARDDGCIDWQVSIRYIENDKEIHIACDACRYIRPLIKLVDGKIPDVSQLDLNWDEYVTHGVIVYKDPAEIENCVVAMTPDNVNDPSVKYDHMEIHPSLMYGICASTIVWADHSQAPRNTYQSAMVKQALGVPYLSHDARADTMSHILEHSQKPLATTRASRTMCVNTLPSGMNANVAIATLTGYNQEDSLIMSEAFVQRGGFRVTAYRTVTYQERKRGTTHSEKVCSVPFSIRRRYRNYSHLGSEGIAQIGSIIEKGDVVIGRIVSTTERGTGVQKQRDASLYAAASETGRVDRIIQGTTSDGLRFIKITIRSVKIPKVGDKFASRSAQKGTVGLMLRTEDMPYTADGVIPDIVINPHCCIHSTLITLKDGTVAQIGDLFDKDEEVTTINPDTLEKSTTRYTDGFKKDCKKLLEVETISGRTVGCTPEHLWLVRGPGGKRSWKKTEDLVPFEDKIVARHGLDLVKGDDGELPTVEFQGHEKYTSRLEEIGLLGELTKRQSLILARLLGLIDSDGHVSYRRSETTGDYTQRVLAVFYVGEDADIQAIRDDVEELGFRSPSVKQLKQNLTKVVRVEPSLGSLLIALGACPGHKTNSDRTFPHWIKRAPSDVRREFLSAYNGGDGSKLALNSRTKQQQIRHRGFRMRATNETVDSHWKYLEEMQGLFADFGIKTRVKQVAERAGKVDLMLLPSLEMENLEKLVDKIGWRYCSQKERESMLPIEILKTMIQLKRTGNKRMGRTNVKEGMTVEFFERWFGEDLAVPVRSVKEIPLEPVYDFTTVSKNHSFIANGLVSHNCIPSRMTINQLIESLASGVIIETGEFRDATPFSEGSTDVVPKIQDRLRSLGLNCVGEHQMFNGFTGEPFKKPVFMGMTFYQRLKHMVDGKMHARGVSGANQVLTRQPLEGRARNGGLRLGEMERDCMLLHGVSKFCFEKLLKASDDYEVDVCRDCKQIAQPDYCRLCKKDNTVKVMMPYAFKLLIQELQTMLIRINIVPSD